MAKKKKPKYDKAAEEPKEGSEKAESKADTKAKKPEDDGDDLHAEALKQYERGFNRDRKNMDEAYFDLRFAADEKAQWDAKAYADRTGQGRPIITVNKVPQFVRQVTGDMRQMRPAIKCVPADDRASSEVADKIMPGMIRYIENRSDAQGSYFNAADSQVMAGIGHWRVMTEYASADTYNQEIRIAPIEDGVAVVWDPDAILPTREDAMFCFVPVDMSRAAFEERYPDKSADALTTVPESFRSWFGDDHVRIAEYWYKKPAKRLLALMPDGGIDDLTDEGEEAVAEAKANGARVESRDGFKVCRAVISASDILEEPDEWPGRHIPIIPLIGEEIKIGREIVRRGVVRTLRGPQQLYNYAVSTQAEVVALQPKSPFIGTKKMFQDFEDQWETANASNWPYLEYTPDPEAPGQKPERAQPALASQGLSELAQVSTADMSAVTGIYPSALGAASNETSGKAILARQREGDTGTFLYIEAFGRAIRRTGQVILDLIPHVYDTERTIQIVGEDGASTSVKINQAAISPQDGITEQVLNDVTIGAYHLVMEMGPSFSTKREEARDGMTTLMQTLGPNAVPLVADIFAKQQDWPLADKLAKRFRMMLPPPIQAMEAEDNGEQPPPMPQPPGPTPEQQMEMAKANGEHQMKQAQLVLDEKKLQVEMAKIEADLEKTRLGHQATMAGHAAGVQTAQASQDPRVDAIAQAVDELRNVVGQIVQAIQGPQQPPPDQMMPQGAPPPMQGGPGLEQPIEQQAPQGAFVPV
jgi:hypothetical protein